MKPKCSCSGCGQNGCVVAQFFKRKECGAWISLECECNEQMDAVQCKTSNIHCAFCSHTKHARLVPIINNQNNDHNHGNENNNGNEMHPNQNNDNDNETHPIQNNGNEVSEAKEEEKKPQEKKKKTQNYSKVSYLILCLCFPKTVQNKINTISPPISYSWQMKKKNL